MSEKPEKSNQSAQLAKYLELVKKDLKKSHPESSTEIILATDELPPTGILLDNPLLEKLVSSRFIPYGRCLLFYGKKADGKTAFFYFLGTLVQKANGFVEWEETENAADKIFAAKQGVDLDRMHITHPETLQEALTMSESFILNMPKAFPEGETPILICLDSIAGTATEYETEQAIIGETKPGDHAKLMSGFYRKIIGPLAHEKCIFVAINQLKEQIGAFGGFGEEKPEALIGGQAQRFHSTLQLKFARTGDIMVKHPDHPDAKIKIGSSHKITCKRNKLGDEGTGIFIEVNLMKDGGWTWYESCVEDLGKRYKELMTKSGGYYRWNIPDIRFFNPVSNQEEVIDTEKNYLVRDMATIIANSPAAKEVIRTAYKIPPLPSIEDVVKVETENKKKRKKKANEEPKSL